jgi:hypothetical protein
MRGFMSCIFHQIPYYLSAQTKRIQVDGAWVMYRKEEKCILGFWWGNKRKRPLVRPGHRWGDYIKLDLKRGRIGGCKLNLAHSRDIWGLL